MAVGGAWNWLARAAAVIVAGAGVAAPARGGAPAAEEFRKTVQPILSQYCYDCHGDGANKGNVTLDQFKSDRDILNSRELWWRVLRNVRAGIMPPAKRERPTDAQQLELANWIKYGAFGIDPAAPDPGRVTLRRLNRVEYRNTIRDLMGVDFNTTDEFPPDDTGYGFDTIGDVLSVSPMLLEKYMQAAETIVEQAVPTVARDVALTQIPGARFRSRGGGANGSKLSFYKEAGVFSTFKAPHPGTYHIVLNLAIRGSFDFDPGACDVGFKIDDAEQWRERLKWENGRKLRIDLERQWEPGEHTLAFELHPLKDKPSSKTSVDLQVNSVDVRGPMEKQYWVKTRNFDRFFTREQPPTDAAERKAYAREVLAAFAKKAFRRPADDRMVDRLVEMCESVWSHGGKSFDDGIKQAMVAVLSSPRFLFRIEQPLGGHDAGASAPVDEYSLASRLSYFLWSTMPDEELIALADRNELRKALPEQLKRMLSDPRSQAFVQNFTGQWLELRDVEGININIRQVLRQDNQPPPGADTQPAREQFSRSGLGGAAGPIIANGLFGKPPFQMDSQLRLALREEPEMLFAEIMRQDESLAGLLDTDHTYLNEKLAALYKIPGLKGPEMRRVELPKDSPRGGLLTMGSILIVTSNPTRTSPVKRGQFVLDNILGMPAPPPPADIPALEASEKKSAERMSFRQVLELHRSQSLCRSCHARMDPLGLSLENFNALGMWREKERGLPIDAAGRLLTGESFHDARDVKSIIKQKHLTDFYRCLTEKMLTYALGRGIEYYDVETVDRIVDRLEHEDGRFSALLNGIVESAAFQRRRNVNDRAVGLGGRSQTGKLVSGPP